MVAANPFFLRDFFYYARVSCFICFRLYRIFCGVHPLKSLYVQFRVHQILIIFLDVPSHTYTVYLFARILIYFRFYCIFVISSAIVRCTFYLLEALTQTEYKLKCSLHFSVPQLRSRLVVENWPYVIKIKFLVIFWCTLMSGSGYSNKAHMDFCIIFLKLRHLEIAFCNWRTASTLLHKCLGSLRVIRY